jgi:hypothetical protein
LIDRRRLRGGGDLHVRHRLAMPALELPAQWSTRSELHVHVHWPHDIRTVDPVL